MEELMAGLREGSGEASRSGRNVGKKRAGMGETLPRMKKALEAAGECCVTLMVGMAPPLSPTGAEEGAAAGAATSLEASM